MITDHYEFNLKKNTKLIEFQIFEKKKYIEVLKRNATTKIDRK